MQADSQLTPEEWRPVSGQPYYEVSSLGRVRSIDRVIEYVTCHGTIARRFWPGKVLKPQVGTTGHGTDGYATVRLARQKLGKIHILVAEAFHGPRPFPDWEVRHLDDNRQDNRAVNLAWGTKSENTLDRVRLGTHHQSRKTHCKAGHEFTPENTIPNTGGRNRACRACARIRGAEWARRNRRKAKADA